MTWSSYTKGSVRGWKSSLSDGEEEEELEKYVIKKVKKIRPSVPACLQESRQPNFFTLYGPVSLWIKSTRTHTQQHNAHNSTYKIHTHKIQHAVVLLVGHFSTHVK